MKKNLAFLAKWRLGAKFINQGSLALGFIVLSSLIVNPGIIAQVSYNTKQVSVFPNPSEDGIVNVNWNMPDAILCFFEVYNSSGAKMHQEAIQPTEAGPLLYSVDLSHLPRGLYITRIRIDARSYTEKVFIGR